MVRFILCIAVVILWAICLGRAFPSDHENSNSYTIIVFVIVGLWVAAAILNFALKIRVPSILLLVSLTIISCAILYYYFPWYKEYGATQIIREYSHKKKNLKNVDIAWIYTLAPRIENYSMIDLAQRKFVNEIKPDKCYLFQCFYYDSSQIQQYVDQYIIYFRNQVPFTTKAGTFFTRSANNAYELTEIIDGQPLALISAKDNVVSMTTINNHQIPSEDNKNSYVSNGKFRFELKSTDPYNGFNVRKAYWIYRFL